MRVIIAGSREGIVYEDVLNAIKESNFNITTVISGTARGVDKFGERYAKENEIEIERYKPDWGKYGKSAGYIRNSFMASVADALIAVWNGNSKGTEHMIKTATDKQLSTFIYNIKTGGVLGQWNKKHFLEKEGKNVR
jgi:hypothetical protein